MSSFYKAPLPPGWHEGLGQIPQRRGNGALSYLYRCARCGHELVHDPADRLASRRRLFGQDLQEAMNAYGIEHLHDLPLRFCPFCSIAMSGHVEAEQYTLRAGGGCLGYRFSWEAIASEEPLCAVMVVLRPGAHASDDREPVAHIPDALTIVTWLTMLRPEELTEPHDATEADLVELALGPADLGRPPGRKDTQGWAWYTVSAGARCWASWPEEDLRIYLALSDRPGLATDLGILLNVIHVFAGRIHDQLVELWQARGGEGDTAVA